MKHADYAFPLGARVTGRDAGDEAFSGTVTRIISAHLVELDDSVITPVSLLDPLLAPAEPLSAPDPPQLKLF